MSAPWLLVIGPQPDPTPESRHDIVRFYFSDADPVAECGCGWRAVGDSATDAFRAWWRHGMAEEDATAEPSQRARDGAE